MHNHFFKRGALPLFCRILVILESHRSSWRRGGCTLPLYLDLTLIKITVPPHTNNTNIDMNNEVEPSCYKMFEFLSHSLKLNERRGHGHSVCVCGVGGGSISKRLIVHLKTYIRTSLFNNAGEM